MSGTSADGVDVAIVEITGRGLAMTARPLAHTYEAFASSLRTQILAMRQRGSAPFSEVAQIGRDVTLAHARAFRAAIAQAALPASQITAIGAHGQTLFHAPPNTMQYFDPSLLACETDCAVVSDFRRADLAAGGQGAPLVPFADWILFRHPMRSRVILNIGGIANLTYLKAGGSIDDVIAYDTGPGNCISDWLMRDTTGFDHDGTLARRGRFSGPVVEHCLHHPYFTAPAPKSTDGPQMVDLFAQAIRERAPDLSQADQLATAAAVVAQTIFNAARSLTMPDEVLISGGGVRNHAILDGLFRRFEAEGVVVSILQPSDACAAAKLDLAAAREAIAFALLAAATLDGEPSNVPSATGAHRRVVLGSITPRPTDA